MRKAEPWLRSGSTYGKAMESHLNARGGKSAPGQEGFQVIGAGGLWEFGEEPREVGMWLDAALAGTE
jgi:hypothetical protein